MKLNESISLPCMLRGLLSALVRFSCLALAALATLPSCGGPPARSVAGAPPSAEAARPHGLRDASPEEAARWRPLLEPATQIVRSRVEAGRLPGAVLLVARHGVILSQLAIGTKEKGRVDPVTADTLFDLESVTKVITAAAALVLADRGKLDLDAPVAKYLPAFTGGGKERVVVRDLIDHSSGLPGDVKLEPGATAASLWSAMLQTPLQSPPHTKVSYSDLGFRIAGRILETVAGSTLDRVIAETITVPLGMKDTLFNPPAALRPRIASTGFSATQKRILRGEVDDDIDLAFGGVAGCDGMFSTARDLATLAQVLLEGGIGPTGARILSRRSVEQATTSQTPWADMAEAEKGWMQSVGAGPKGVGWEMATRGSAAGTTLSLRSFGKGGISGTFVWADPDSGLVAVYLTNLGPPASFEALAGWYADLATNDVFTAIGAAVAHGGE